MLFGSVILLALAAFALSHPQHHSHHHHLHATGTAGATFPAIHPGIAALADEPEGPCISSTATATYTSVEYVTLTVQPRGFKSWFHHPSHGLPPAQPFTATAAPQVPAPPQVLTTFATSLASSVPSSVPPATGGSSSGKKGLSYNDASLTNLFTGDGMTWAYNWAASPGGTIASGLEYVPMLWGLNSVSGWSSAASAAISSGSSHLLGFNEPDLSSQSNISPQDAAANHIKYMNPFAGQAQIGSPAVTNGAGSSPPMGATWMQQFFEACAGQCHVDFLTFHWYNDASQIQDFQNHVQEMISLASQNGIGKVWITEFGVTGSDDEVSSFLSQAMEYLDSQSGVERYAYFMCGDGTLLSGSSLSTLGETYAS